MTVPPELVHAARAGNSDALDALLRRSRQDLRRYAEYHCEINDVEDAVQESLFIVARHLVQLRQVEAMASWLFRIVKRECNRMRRAWRQLRQQPLDPSIEPIVLPEPIELRLEIGRSLAAVPGHYREILLMRDVEGMTLAEMARALDLSLPAVKSRLHRARVLVREHLTSATNAPAPASVPA